MQDAVNAEPQQQQYRRSRRSSFSGDDMISSILVVLITIFLPPLGVFLVAGCGADLLVNILLTILGYFPGHIHAFYVEYVYYKRRDEARMGVVPPNRAPGVFSDRVNRGGYGTMQNY